MGRLTDLFKRSHFANEAELLKLLNLIKTKNIKNPVLKNHITKFFISRVHNSTPSLIANITTLLGDDYLKIFIDEVLVAFKKRTVDVRTFNFTQFSKCLLAIQKTNPDEVGPFYNYLCAVIRNEAYTVYDIDLLCNLLVEFIQQGYVTAEEPGPVMY